MRNLIALLILMWVLALGIQSIGSRPSTLELSVILADGGEDVTDQFRRYVGFVPDGRSGQPTLGNIKIINSIEGHDAIYEVPPNRRIGIFVLSRSGPPFESVITVNPRQHLKHNVVLDAGLVTVTAEFIGPTTYPNIWYVEPDGQIDTNDRLVDGAQFLVPAGEQVFQVGRSLETKRENVSVVAGQRHDVNIISEIGTLSINLETIVPFEALSPTPIIRTDDGGKLLHLRDNGFDAGRWQFGSHYSRLELFERFHIPIRPAATEPLLVTIDQPENSMTVPLPLMAVEVLFGEWADNITKHATAMVVSVTDPGPPFATYRVKNNRAPLMFLPPPEAHDYAIALVDKGDVLALHAVHTLSTDIPKTLTVSLGGDVHLCETVVLGFNCSTLSN
ncbi:MAG: hypothetical protein ABJ251_23640 [Paracoccaceae bacterium]